MISRRYGVNTVFMKKKEGILQLTYTKNDKVGVPSLRPFLTDRERTLLYFCQSGYSQSGYSMISPR